MDFNIERENNIIKNIATEVVAESLQQGMEVTQELANYVVKLKLLNPKNGFTASEVMPRSLTQQLVTSTVEDLKQDTPAMNCIRMQVYWTSVKMNLAELKKDYNALITEKAEPFLNELILQDTEDTMRTTKPLANFAIVYHNLGQPNTTPLLKEISAAVHSVFKSKDAPSFLSLPDEAKTETVKIIAKRVTGIRLYLKRIGKVKDGSDEVKDLISKIEDSKDEISLFEEKLTAKIDLIRKVIRTFIPMIFFDENIYEPGNAELPPDCDSNDLNYLKKILVIMIQHNIYISDVWSKLEEIDGTVNFFVKECEETLQRLQATIRDREAVPTTEVYDDFERAGELWQEIQSYFYCLESVRGIFKNLENINKQEYFELTPLEKAIAEKETNAHMTPGYKKSIESSKGPSALALKGCEDFHLEFNGFCAWTIFYAGGYLEPGNSEAGIFQYQDQYYTFADKRRHELWAKDPQYYLMEVYEYLRQNPEMIELLNAYENLYNTKNLQLTKKIDKKKNTRAEDTQTVLHPIEEYWDKDYTFSIWELKKEALKLSRLVKCVTKSVQTTSPHSHYRASIGVLAAPDKDKEIQTMKDSSCVHSTISNYLYGLRGHREDKFRVIDLTRPIEESCKREITLREEDPCRERYRRRQQSTHHHAFALAPCPSLSSVEKCCFKYDSNNITETSNDVI